VTQELGE
jgi:hypothetical protein